MRLLVLPALAVSLATPALPQAAKDQPGFWEQISAELIAKSIFNQLVVYARVGADLRYDALTADPLGGTLRLSGLDVRPHLPYSPGDACSIKAALVTLRGSEFTDLDTMRVQVTLDRAVVDFDCLPFEVRPMVGMMNISDIEIDRLNLRAAYDLPSGALTLDWQAGIDGLARLNGNADFDYVSFRMNYATEEPEPAAHLSGFRVQIEDDGAMARLRQIVPPEMLSEDVLVSQTHEALLAAFSELSPNATGALQPAEVALMSQAEEMARAVANGADRLVIESDIGPDPLRLAEDTISTDPMSVLAALNLRIAPETRSEETIVPRDLLARALNGQQISDAERKMVGAALLTGIGAPKLVSEGVTLLTPLAEAGDTEAARMLSEALIGTNPKAAYALALTAASAGDSAAVALADRAEDLLTLRDVIDVQDDALTEEERQTLLSYESLSDMRSAAQEYLMGHGRPRNFSAAHILASMAAAGGDTAAAALRDELADRMERRGYADEWAAHIDKLNRSLLTEWIDRDIPGRLQPD